MINQNKKIKILGIFKKYNARMKQIEKAKIKIINEIKDEQSRADLDKIRKKLQNL
jgi:hypothetical protein